MNGERAVRKGGFIMTTLQGQAIRLIDGMPGERQILSFNSKPHVWCVSHTTAQKIPRVVPRDFHTMLKEGNEG